MKHAVLQLSFLLFLAFLLPRISHGQLVSVTAGNILVEVDVFSVAMSVVTFDSQGVATKIPNFGWTLNVDSVGRLNMSETLTEYSLASLTRTFTETNSSYPNATATTWTQSATLPDNSIFSFEVMKVDSITYKNYFGWELPLDPDSIKITYRFSNIEKLASWTNYSVIPQFFVLANVTFLMEWGNYSFLSDGGEADWPIDYWMYQLSTPIDPNPPGPIGMRHILFRDARLNLTMDFISNSSVCTADVCNIVDLAHLHFLNQSDIESIVLPLQEGKDPRFYSAPLLATMYGYYLYPNGTYQVADAVEWDPNVNLNLLVSAASPPPVNATASAPNKSGQTVGNPTPSGGSNTIAIAVGVSLGAAVVIIVVVIGAISWHRRTIYRSNVRSLQMQMRSHNSTTVLSTAVPDASPLSQSAVDNQPVPSTNSTTSSTSSGDEQERKPFSRNRQWTRSVLSTSLTNTYVPPGEQT